MEEKVFDELAKEASENLGLDFDQSRMFFKYFHRSLFKYHIANKKMEIEIPGILKTKYTKKTRKIIEFKKKVFQLNSKIKRTRMY